MNGFSFVPNSKVERRKETNASCLYSSDGIATFGENSKQGIEAEAFQGKDNSLQ